MLDYNKLTKTTTELISNITKEKWNEWNKTDDINMLTLEKLKEEIKPYVGTLVLNLFEVVRLSDVIENEDDFYYVYNEQFDKINYSSCVMSFIPLKHALKKEDYIKLVKVWNLNNDIQAI